jgi:hypothetical protein
MDGRVIKQIGGIGVTGVGLLFDGGPGLGKTTHAVVTAMEFVRRLPANDAAAQDILGISADNYGMSARPIYYMTFPEFLSRKKALIDADPETKKVLTLEMEGFHGRATDDQLNVRLLVWTTLVKSTAQNMTTRHLTKSLGQGMIKLYQQLLQQMFPVSAGRTSTRRQWGVSLTRRLLVYVS